MSVEELKQRLSYDAATGTVRWTITYSSHAIKGKEAGCVNAAGYKVIRINKKLHLAHRIAWAIEHGAWPENEIDHINGDRLDNRLVNLRQATHAENSCNTKMQSNNTSGFKGVHRHKNGWRAVIKSGGRTRCLGVHVSKEAAAKAYAKAASLYHGNFVRLTSLEACHLNSI